MAKLDLTAPIFHDEDAARAHLKGLLWPQGPNCPRCGVMGDRIKKLEGKSTRPGVYNVLVLDAASAAFAAAGAKNRHAAVSSGCW